MHFLFFDKLVLSIDTDEICISMANFAWICLICHKLFQYKPLARMKNIAFLYAEYKKAYRVKIYE